MPLVAAYTASKTAIEGFTESLTPELTPFKVSVKLVEPSYGPGTQFTANGAQRMQGLIPRGLRPVCASHFFNAGSAGGRDYRSRRG